MDKSTLPSDLEAVGKHFLIGLQKSTRLTEHDARLLSVLRPSGIILYRENFKRGVAYEEWLSSLRELIEAARACIQRKTFLITIDHEGGVVFRPPQPITDFGSAATWAARSGEVGTAMGVELRSLGINLNYAPVVDIHTNPTNPVIGTRAFGSTDGIVADSASNFVIALERGGVTACPKHFPGHCDTGVDSTGELADVGGKVMRQNGARSAPTLVYGFPGDVLISLNEEAVHGIPKYSRKVQAGDPVKLDVTFEKDGYMADAAITVPVRPVSEDARRLVACAERAFQMAMSVARANHRVSEIGRIIEQEVRRSGFRVIRELCGHGIGHTIHEKPPVLNFDDASARQRLTPGLVLTVEPIIAIGSGRPMNVTDGWTVKAADGGLSAHYEHTLVVTDGAPLLLTAA